jgi:glycine/D-amino acid oxidase-like deaminating enzyme
VTSTADAVVIGAGIVGTACADALTAAGMKVAVVETGVIGGGATAAGMGHVVVMEDSPAELALTRRSRDLWDRIAPDLPREVEFETAGTLWVAADGDEMDEVRRKAASYAAAGVTADILDGAGLASAEPNLRSGMAGGLLVPDDIVLYAPCAAHWLLGRALGRGASLVPGTVASLEPDGVRLSDGSRISAAISVCATGAAIPLLLPAVPVRPRKGHLAITDRYPGFVRHQVIELGYLKSAHGSASESVAFNVQPRRTGQVLIGSSRQFGSQDPRADAPMLGRMLDRAAEYMPGLVRLSIVRTWTGFRAATDDKLPLIGPYPGHGRVYLATGHEGLGITTSLVTGELIADLVLGRNPAIDPTPYLPARLEGRTSYA